MRGINKEKENIQVEEISQLSELQQAEAIADSFSSISQQYSPIKKENINIPSFLPSSIPQFSAYQVKQFLDRTKTKKSTAPGDIPSKIVKQFSNYLSIPVADIINSGLKAGVWPHLYKCEYITPVPKQFPPDTMDMLRPISNLFNFDKTMQTMV